jgi:hypothetical protein
MGSGLHKEDGVIILIIGPGCGPTGGFGMESCSVGHFLTSGHAYLYAYSDILLPKAQDSEFFQRYG